MWDQTGATQSKCCVVKVIIVYIKDMSNASTTQITINQSKAGGYRRLKRLRYSEQRLLKALWEKHGGVSALHKTTGMYAQSFINWRNIGRVPLKHAGTIARILDLPTEVLNYEEVGVLNGENSDWVEIVKTCNFDAAVEDWVLQGILPTPFRNGA